MLDSIKRAISDKQYSTQVSEIPVGSKLYYELKDQGYELVPTKAGMNEIDTIISWK